MYSLSKYIIYCNETVENALIKLDKLVSIDILFVVDENNKLIGLLTDGDLRRGFIRGLGFEDSIKNQKNPYEQGASSEKKLQILQTIQIDNHLKERFHDILF